jgi:predicted RNA binding protein YcfA (HicA-like mRNA interferase family)
MSTTEKLLEKLNNGSISAKELRTLLGKLNWFLDRTKGSHEQWIGPQKQRMTIATHSKDLKSYQIKEAQQKIKQE